MANQNFVWNGAAGDDNLDNPNNWATNPGGMAGEPGTTDTATINANSNVTLSGDLDIVQLMAGGGFTIDQATLTLATILVLTGDLTLFDTTLSTNNLNYNLTVDNTSMEIDESDMTLAGNLIVGQANVGSVFEDDLASSISVPGVIVGNMAGADGHMTVSDSTLKTDRVTVGGDGNGIGLLTLTEGANLKGLTSTAPDGGDSGQPIGVIFIGYLDDSDGTLEITAPYGQYPYSSIFANQIYLANGPNTIGAMNIDEGTLVVYQGIQVGANGNGGMDFAGGLTETFGDIVTADLRVAVAPGSTGNLTVDSMLTVSTPNSEGAPVGPWGTLTIGWNGNATAAFNSTANVSAGDITLAYLAGSVADVDINFATVTLHLDTGEDGKFWVGFDGVAMLDVADSALTDYGLAIGQGAGSDGDVVMNATNWYNYGELDVGSAGGLGYLMVENASLLYATTIRVNSDEAAGGGMYVANSTWYTDNLFIGTTAAGTLEFGGGNLEGFTNASVANITVGSNGNAGEFDVNYGAFVTAVNVNIGAQGMFVLAPGGVVDVEDENPTGGIIKLGGTLNIGPVNGGQYAATAAAAQATAGTVNVTGSGVLAGYGIIDGNLNDNATAYAAVVAQGGLLEITGNVSGSTSGPLVVASNAVLQIDGADTAAVNLLDGAAQLNVDDPKDFKGTIIGFGTTDLIDLIGLPYSATGPAPVLESGNVLSITEDGSTFDLGFDPTQNYSGYHFVLISDGNGGSYVAVVPGAPPPAVPPLLGFISTGDFNHSADADVAFQGADGTVTLWIMNGANATAVTEGNPGQSWVFSATGDFNGDGNSDLVFQNVNGTPAVWLMNGTTLINAATLPNPTASWHIDGTGDATDTGHNESILFQNNDGQPAIWVLNGTNVVNTYALSNPGPSWLLNSAGDFFDSGFNNSLLFQNVNGTPAIWEMNGGTIVNAFTLPNPTASFRIIGVGDFAGDGHNDSILFQNTDGQPAIWVMNGSTIVKAFALANPGPQWQITGIGDFNGDGTSDIFFENTGTNQDAVWFMSGGNVVASSIITPTTGQLTSNSTAYSSYAAAEINSAPSAATQAEPTSNLTAAGQTAVLGINQHA